MLSALHREQFRDQEEQKGKDQKNRKTVRKNSLRDPIAVFFASFMRT
jgi:hypothetical protein